MASTKKGKKKTLTQDDLRKLMKEQKTTKKAASKRIDSPLAKYNSLGQLVCVVCQTQVKTELLWNAHIQGRTHKEACKLRVKTHKGSNERESASERDVKSYKMDFQNLALLKAKNDAKNTATVPLPPGILKRTTQTQDDSSSPKRARLQAKDGASGGLPTDFFDNKKEAPKTGLGLGDYSSSDDEMDTTDQSSVQKTTLPPPTNTKAPSGLPADFFDAAAKPSTAKEEPDEVKPHAMSDKLPEGFFDDPKLDAKVRQVEYRDKMDDEWEMFQRAMKEETIRSEALQEEDDEAIITERNIEEIDDQLHRWTKVDTLAKEKEKLVVKEVKPEPEAVNDGIVEDECSDDDADHLDWRMT